jgi:hypothetical protein
MDPVFTLPWPEFHLANRLQGFLPKKDGYSIFVPLSRQEKGADLAIFKISPSGKRVITLQIKASRTWIAEPRTNENRKRFQYTMRFNCFNVPKEADFILFLGMYSPEIQRTRRIEAGWYTDCTLLLTRAETEALMMGCKTKSGKPDIMFYFGFDTPAAVFQTRGICDGKFLEYSDKVLDRRIHMLRQALG